MSKKKVSQLNSVTSLMEKCGATLQIGDGAIYFLVESKKLTSSDIGWLRTNGAHLQNGETISATGLVRVIFA